MSTKKTTRPYRTPISAEHLTLSWFFQPIGEGHLAHLKTDAGQPTLASLQAEIRELKKVVSAIAPSSQVRPVG